MLLKSRYYKTIKIRIYPNRPHKNFILIILLSTNARYVNQELFLCITHARIKTHHIQDKDVPDLPCFPQCHLLHWNLPIMETKGINFFPVIGSFRFIQVLLWILGTPVPRDRKVFPKKTGLRSAQAPFKTGFSVYVFSEDLLLSLNREKQIHTEEISGNKLKSNINSTK